MERSEFKERLQQYKKAREKNPGLKYWEWKDIPKYGDGTKKVAPTEEEYITQQIAAKKADALERFRNITEPVLPIINGEPNVNSCIFTALNMYGKEYATPGNWTFYDAPNKFGFKQKELSNAQPSDLIQVFDKNKPYHMMMLDGYDDKGLPLYNYSRGMKGDSSDIVKAKTNFPNTKKKAYEYVGTAADSTQWKNEYKQLYGYADGGEVTDDPRKQILNRSVKVASNYSDAKDFTLDPLNYAIRKISKTLTGRGGISNCTLSATGWIDPNNQYMSARNLFNNPKSGYVEIDKAYALPGDLLIAKNPEKDSYHTMLIEGFNGNDPLLRYSRGGHNTKKNLVTGRSLEEYHRLDNEQGGNHTEDHYFRYSLPNEYWLPEIVVTPKR